MALETILIHLLSMLLPAWLLGLLLLLVTRMIWRGSRWRLPFWANGAALGLAGSLAILLGLLITGRDGTVLGYVLLVLALASVQWAVLRPGVED